MATWHQKKNPVKLWSETTWNVVIDPPNGMISIIKCDSREQAEQVQAKREHSYIINPYPRVTK